uniref:Reverse transcriptase domain-containing protein n=1 Tax=Cannabis sativa TaxID=3483 RepID=A0A803PII9_CANSA
MITVEGHRPFRFTGIYGEPNRSQRRQTWVLLRTRFARSVAPWCIMGDFNHVLHQCEKRGGNPYPTWLIEGFQEVVQQCGLCDLDMLGRLFTWEKSRDTPNWIEARLDRAMANNDSNYHVAAAPVRTFKFENYWTSHQDCEKIIHDSWCSMGGVSIAQKINHCGQMMPEGMQNTNIVLIPKKKNPDQMSELRPISLCNVIAKVITKVLANTMKGLMAEIISVNQSAFIPDYLITDNIMVSFEILHYLKRKQSGKDGYMALKLDLSKAYDRVDWHFLCAMLGRMGFTEKWIRLIYGCLSTVQYNIVSSGYTLGPIVPSRGLRQEDPISPYLFLICAEGLSTLIRRYEEKKWLHGCKVANGAPIVSHMLFADDSLLYCKATNEEVFYISKLLQTFAEASGQRVNFEKSTVFFSSNTHTPMREVICQRLGIQEANENSKYLGLPSTIGRNKKVVFNFLTDKAQKRIQSWDNKFLSRAGKEVLIKSVVQALPTCTMNVFLIPIGICQDIERAISKFWWRSNSNKGIHWVSWDKLSKHKSDGGMGFRNYRDFNLALLAKQGWRLLTCGDSLVGKIFKARYYANGNFLTATLGSNSSYIWRSILESQGVIRSAARRVVGNGSQASILKDLWLIDDENPFVESQHPGLVGKMVNSLMKVGEFEWDDEVLLVWKIPLANTGINVDWYWCKEANGDFTVISAYVLLQQAKTSNSQPSNSGFWLKLWELKLPPKVKDFLWRVCTNSLPTKFQLSTKHVPIDTVCPLCMAAPETALHVLVRCVFAQQCWRQTRVPTVGTAAMTFSSWNDLVRNSKQPTYEEVLLLAKINFIDWYNAQKEDMDASNNANRNWIEHWTPPAFNQIKINVDGALFAHEKRYGLGLVSRSSDGAIIQEKTMNKVGTFQAHEVEAIGIKEALSWIKDMGWANVIVESDCLRVINDLENNKFMASPYFHIISDCKALLADVSNVSFQFVKRFANKVAHVLGRSSLIEADCIFSRDTLPTVIASLVLEDLN